MSEFVAFKVMPTGKLRARGVFEDEEEDVSTLGIHPKASIQSLQVGEGSSICLFSVFKTCRRARSFQTGAKIF